MMSRTRLLLAVSAAAAAVVSLMAAGPAVAGESEQKLIAVLQSDAPPQEKAITCKRLAVCGTAAAVPALAPLLEDATLASWARIALEAIPDPAVDEALRAAMGKLQGRLLVGVINSIARRRDAKAVEALAAKLKDADAEVASAAAAALGHIGGAEAAKALEPLLATAPAGVRSDVAEGCVLCAERFLAEGKADEAAKLYDTVRSANVSKQRTREAIRGAILARKAAGVPMLAEMLRSKDKELFSVGLHVARELPGPEATDAVAAELAQAAVERQVPLLLAIADRADPKAFPAVLQAAKSGPAPVRIVAMSVLERIGNASCIPVLLEAALDADAVVADTAKATLGRLPGQEADAAVLSGLPQATGKKLQVLVGLAGVRRLAAALPAIVKSAEDADAGVRAAAVDALGAMGGEAQAADLVKILQKGQDPKDQPGIEKALMAISARVGAACVRHLNPLATSEDRSVRAIALRALVCAGGPDALAIVTAALSGGDEASQAEAVRTLSTWPNRWPEDVAVMEPLLAVAKSDRKMAQKILAVRGYVQCVQGATKLPEDQKLAKVKDILPALTRPEEKRLAVAALGALSTPGALEALAALAADTSVAEEACAAIVHFAGKKDLKGVSKEQLRSALQTAAEKAKAGATRREAEKRLKALK